jgi:hypothetical protein
MNKLSSKITGTASRVVFAALAALVVAGVTGCASPAAGLSRAAAGLHDAPVIPPPGSIVSIYKAPLQVDFNDPSTPAVSPRSGMSETQYVRIPFLYLSFAWGDGSLEKATAGMQKVHYADYELFNVLYIYQKLTVHASGE